MTKTLNNDQQRLVNDNLGFAEQLAWRFGGSILGDQNEKSITMDDLRQEAMLGLCEAAMRYDQALQVEFTTLAFIWCRKFVLKAVRKYSGPLSVPDNYDGEGTHILHLDLTTEDMAGCEADDDGLLADRLLYQMAIEEERELDAEEQRQMCVSRALEGLSPKERMAITYLFGLEGQEPAKSSQAVAKVLGVAPNRFCQIKECALRKLERALDNQRRH